MSLTMSEITVPVFVRMLNNLSALIDKAEAFAAARKIDPKVLLEARLAPDMFPFTRQVQIAADFAKGASARLAGVEVPSYADTETTIGEVKERIARTIAFVTSLDRAAIDAGDDREISITIAGAALTLKGRTYLNGLAMPNFYFHVSMAYAILRENGVEVGKRDFIGNPSA